MVVKSAAVVEIYPWKIQMYVLSSKSGLHSQKWHTSHHEHQRTEDVKKACPCTWAWHLFVTLVFHAWWMRHFHLAVALQSDSFPLVTVTHFFHSLSPSFLSVHCIQDSQDKSNSGREDHSCAWRLICCSCFKWKCDLAMNDWLKQRQRQCYINTFVDFTTCWWSEMADSVVQPDGTRCSVPQ